MKKIAVIAFIATACFCAAFRPAGQPAAATVNQVDGLYVFIQSQPVSEYQTLGTVSKKVAWTGGSKEMLHGIIDKAKSGYPTANGVIFNEAMDKAVVIQFK